MEDTTHMTTEIGYRCPTVLLRPVGPALAALAGVGSEPVAVMVDDVDDSALKATFWPLFVTKKAFIAGEALGSPTRAQYT